MTSLCHVITGISSVSLVSLIYITRKSMLFECALSSFHLLILVDCITRSWNITRNNINRAFSLFLGYAIDRHDARTQVLGKQMEGHDFDRIS